MSQVSFMHTSDLHMRESGENSWELLGWLMEKCSERQAALLITGDFFDSEEEAAGARDRVKQIFDEAPQVSKFILPGNKDAGAFPEGAEYGREAYTLSGTPFTAGFHEGVEIVGFPFVANSSLRSQLAEYRPPGKPLIAMVHGTYFGRGKAAFFQDARERAQEYFPIYSSDLKDIEANYAALGHYHAEHASFVLEDTVVCYPGTPVALASRETGIRTVVAVAVDTESGEVNIERLPVPVGIYNIRENVEVFACAEEDAFAALERSLQERADPRASLTVRLKGNIHMLESNMNDRLAALKGKYGGKYAKLVLRNETASYRSLIDERPLVRDFMAHLAAAEELDEETRARALELGLHAFDKVSGKRGFRR